MMKSTCPSRPNSLVPQVLARSVLEQIYSISSRFREGIFVAVAEVRIIHPDSIMINQMQPMSTAFFSVTVPDS
jgi:hypothetical protein